MIEPKEGDLKVWWIPQVPMKTFDTNVKSVEEAILLLDTLARYDAFQFENNIKPDYCNVGGLSRYETSSDSETGFEWFDWTNEDGDTIDEVRKNMKE